MTKTNEDPRKAMLRVRAYVKAFMSGRNPKGKQISDLSQYPTTIADKKRTIIALQDLLETEMDKHTKASGIIESMSAHTSKQTAETFHHLTHMRRMIADYRNEVASLTAVIKSRDKNIAMMDERWKELNDLNAELAERIGQLEHTNDAAMVTLKATLNVPVPQMKDIYHG